MNIESMIEKIIEGYNRSLKKEFGEMPQIIYPAAKEDFREAEIVSSEYFGEKINEQNIKNQIKMGFSAFGTYYYPTHKILIPWRSNIKFSPAHQEYGLTHEMAHAYQRNTGFMPKYEPDKSQTENFAKKIVMEGHADYLAINMIMRFPDIFTKAASFVPTYEYNMIRQMHNQEVRRYMTKFIIPDFKLRESDMSLCYPIGYTFILKQEQKGRDPDEVLFNPPKTVREMLYENCAG